MWWLVVGGGVRASRRGFVHAASPKRRSPRAGEACRPAPGATRTSSADRPPTRLATRSGRRASFAPKARPARPGMKRSATAIRRRPGSGVASSRSAASAVRRLSSSSATSETHATCGVRITFGASSSGLSSGSGSISVTSSAAPATCPPRSASTSASSSSRPPRPMLTTSAPGGSRASSRAPIMWRVSGVSGTCSERMSARASSSSSSSSSTPATAASRTGRGRRR